MAIAAPLASLAAPTAGADEGWFVRAYGGISELSDTDGDAVGIDGVDGKADISLDTGFTAGLGAGYRFGNNWAAELAWEYRSNDNETELPSGAVYDDGNYASSTVFLNGYYHFDRSGRWDPYVGAGVGWLQEVDIDLEDASGEISYSGDGDIGFQVFGGVNYHFSEAWAANAEIRYGMFSDLDLEGESDAPGELQSLDYEPLTIQFGIRYAF
jgi:opacity protein-like surface antigen